MSNKTQDAQINVNFLFRYSRFSLFAVVIFYEVAAINTESANTEPSFLGEYEVSRSFCSQNFQKISINICLFYVCVLFKVILYNKELIY